MRMLLGWVHRRKGGLPYIDCAVPKEFGQTRNLIYTDTRVVELDLYKSHGFGLQILTYNDGPRSNSFVKVIPSSVVDHVGGSNILHTVDLVCSICLQVIDKEIVLLRGSFTKSYTSNRIRFVMLAPLWYEAEKKDICWLVLLRTVLDDQASVFDLERITEYDANIWFLVRNWVSFDLTDDLIKFLKVCARQM